MNGADVVDAAMRWLDTPFLHQGRVRGAGVDCIGLVIGVGREVGAWPESFDYTTYGRQPNNGVLLREVQRHCIEIPLSDITPGCILLMRWKVEPQHAAVFAGETIIHAAETFGRVVTHGYDAKWPKRVQHAFRLPGVSYV